MHGESASGFSEGLLRFTERDAAWGTEQLDSFSEVLLVEKWSVDLSQCPFRQTDRERRISLVGTLITNEQS